jgi:hypothetical protein
MLDMNVFGRRCRYQMMSDPTTLTTTATSRNAALPI